MKEGEVAWRVFNYVFLFENRDVEICNKGCWRHAHCDTLVLFDDYVSKAHAVVFNDQ